MELLMRKVLRELGPSFVLEIDVGLVSRLAFSRWGRATVWQLTPSLNRANRRLRSVFETWQNSRRWIQGLVTREIYPRLGEETAG